jgi:hypothetical protein
MSKEINPTYVTFEQAKLLKEKGFNEITKSIYQYENLEIDNDYVNFRNSLFSYDYFEISAPEQWQVVEWLYETYGIDVSVIPVREKGTKSVYFQYRVVDFRDDNVDEVLYEHQYNRRFLISSTKKESYSAAFDYILKELI